MGPAGQQEEGVMRGAGWAGAGCFAERGGSRAGLG